MLDTARGSIIAAFDLYFVLDNAESACASAPAAGEFFLVVPAVELAAVSALSKAESTAVGTAVIIVGIKKVAFYSSFVKAFVGGSFFVNRKSPCSEPVAVYLFHSDTVYTT